MSTTTAYSVSFDDDREPLLEELGGKGASLATMTHAGMPVPPGFILTTASFDDFMEEAGIAQRIREKLEEIDPTDVAGVEELSGKIRDALCSRPVPKQVRAALVDSYNRLVEQCGGVEVPVAVRSSATAEDLPDASFAGQQDTYLWVSGLDEVAKHIRQCWASLFTSRAILYRLKNNIPNEGLSMAVVVQKMVNAHAAGVAMTLNPSNGDRSKITVDASWGLGETVVSGEVTPDNILLDKITLQKITEHIGDKHIELVPDQATGELITREVPAERSSVACLSDDELRSVAEMAKRAEKHYGTPQDIEWALDADLPAGENILLLQSRPETVHSAAAEDKKKAATPTTPGAGLGFDLGSITASLTK